MTKTPNTSRAVDIQVPGEAAPVADQGQAAEAQPVRRTRPQEPEPEMEQEAEKFDEDVQLPVATRRSYAKMRAADIDPAKLTAPVMTLDGWLCPPAPEKK